MADAPESILTPAPQDSLLPPQMPPNLSSPKSGDDLSKNAILVLLVLTILVSAFGTWTVLKATENIQYSSPPAAFNADGTPSTAHVSIRFGSPEEAQPPQPLHSYTTGFVAINIQPRSEAP